VRSYDTKKPFEGVVTNINRRFRETDSEWAREELAKYFSDVPCDACHGHRLKPEALCVKIGGKHIGEISELSVRRAGEWFETVPKVLNAQQNEIAARVLKEIRERLSFLLDVGLNYLTLARASGTLSGGESQRNSPRVADRLGPDRRALCAGRALDRPAPARQRKAIGNPEAAARSRQYRDRGRA